MYIYILLILFFVSLAGIVLMIGRKLVLLRKGEIVVEEKIESGVAPLEKVKHITLANLRKYEHIALVGVLRVYVRVANFFINKYKIIKLSIRHASRVSRKDGQNKEISKFLKIIGDYKRRIRDIKHKIKKEENL